MAHESFENQQVAHLLNQHFVAVKVDKEERPDVDSVYMAACMTFTGSGGWPLSIFMTPDQKPFYAGTYFPPKASRDMPGFTDVLTAIAEEWRHHRKELLSTAETVTQHLNQESQGIPPEEEQLIAHAVELFRDNFDTKHGGFGPAPKFPAPHNLMFLLEYSRLYGEKDALAMAEKTLLQLYKGGIFDHIGYGFSRYSTDRYFLVPHFEKMLYDNALLIMAYCKAYEITKKDPYKKIVQQTTGYVFRELAAPSGGFYSAQDADSEGIEGKYYVFDYEEVIAVLGLERGTAFNAHYNITRKGNFVGKSIPNLLHKDKIDSLFLEECRQLYQYRKKRTVLHLDDKILTGQNCLMIGALCMAYQQFGHAEYLQQAQKSMRFIQSNLKKGELLLVSFREKAGETKGFLEDYAFYIFSLLELYRVTLHQDYLSEALRFTEKAVEAFYDHHQGGFFIYGKHNEALIARPKETYDGAIPSGNAMMAYNLIHLWRITKDEKMETQAKDQLQFLASQAADYPAGHSFFLYSLLQYMHPRDHIVCVFHDGNDKDAITKELRKQYDILVLDAPTKEYPLHNGKTTYYVCANYHCHPPVNDLMELAHL